MAESAEKSGGGGGGCAHVRKTLNDFAGWTSAHGVPHVASADRLPLRLFWLAAMLAAAGVFAKQMYHQVDRYFQREISVQTQLKFDKRAFPSVFICPLDPATNNSEVEALSAAFQAARQLAHQRAHNATASTDGADVFKFAQHIDNMEAHAHTWSQFIMHRAAENQPQSHSNDYNSTIINCAYNTKPCFERHFKQYFDAEHGNCYIFNPGGQLESTRAGPLYGLRLLLRLHQRAYAAHTRAAGAKIAVHASNSVGQGDGNASASVSHALGDKGIDAAPGFSTSIGVRYVQTDRLPAPHGDCKHYEAHMGQLPQTACRLTCLQKHITANCGCFDPTLSHAEDNVAASCSSGPLDSVAINIDCVVAKKRQFEEAHCHCPDNCTQRAYDVTVSSTVFPSEVYKPAECNNKKNANRDPNQCMQWYRRNTLMLEVFYERINFQRIYDTEAYGLINLLSDTGGQVGLWLGMSFITCVEFACLLLLLCGIGVKGCRHGGKGDGAQHDRVAQEDNDAAAEASDSTAEHQVSRL